MGAGTGTKAGALTGNYISASDIDNWPAGYSDLDKQEVIRQVEDLVEKITGDLFYEEDFDICMDGGGKDRLFLPFKEDILSVTTIEISGVDLSSDYWTYDKRCVHRDPEAVTEPELRWLQKQYRTSGLFPVGEGNIHIVGTYGWLVTPQAIIDACVILCRDNNDKTIYTHYIKGIQQIGDYQYRYDGKVLTGVWEADVLLEKYIRRRALMRAV